MTLFERNCDCDNTKNGRFRPKHVGIYFANKHHHLAYNYSCVF